MLQVSIQSLDEITSEQLAVAIARLPEWRRESCLRYRHELGRKQSCMAYLLLCDILREYCNITEQPRFQYNEHDKPSLADYPHIYFNLSHCREAVACVISDSPVGIDIESRGRYKESLARYTMNDAELTTIQQAADPDEAFTVLWTCKEAVLKLSGSGLTVDPKLVLGGNERCQTTLAPDYVYTVAQRGDSELSPY